MHPTIKVDVETYLSKPFQEKLKKVSRKLDKSMASRGFGKRKMETKGTNVFKLFLGFDLRIA